MSEGIKKFVELMNTDKDFQEKLKNALESYTGERTEEAIFESVLAPLAKEYGITASFEEYKNFAENRELSEDELAQVAGGTADKTTHSFPICIIKGADGRPEGTCPCGMPNPFSCPENAML